MKIICLHGGPGMDQSYFQPYLLPLADPVELVFYNQGSSGPDIGALINELDEVVKTYSKGKVILLGHDFGGQLALQYLQDKGQDKVAGLILTSWYHSKGWAKHARRKHATEVEALDKDVETAIAGLTDPNEILQERTAHFAALHFPPATLSMGLKLLRSIQYNAEVHAAISDGYVEKSDLSEFIKSLKVPCLSITGALDGILDPEYVKKGAGLNLKIQAIELKESGHFPFVDEQQEFIRLVQRFVLTIDPNIGKAG